MLYGVACCELIRLFKLHCVTQPKRKVSVSVTLFVQYESAFHFKKQLSPTSIKKKHVDTKILKTHQTNQSYS